MSKDIDILEYTPFTYENLTIATDAVTQLTLAHRSISGAVFITFEDNSVNFRIDGGDPTSALGHTIISSIHQSLWLADPSSIRNLRLIALDGNALAKVTYYRKQ